MRTLAIRAAAASLAALAISGCTTTGMGTGQSQVGNIGASFTYTQTGPTRGTMLASLTNGQVYQGQFFQITQESRVTDYGPLWNGWGPGFGWGRGWGGRRYGYGWGGWVRGARRTRRLRTIAARSSPICRARAVLMRCNFALASPSAGIAGGGAGQCQLPSGAIIHAQFPRAYR